MPMFSAIALIALASIWPILGLRTSEIWYAIAVGLGFSTIRYVRPRALPVLTGAALALLPFAGPHIIPIAIAIYLALSIRRLQLTELRWATPALAFLLGTVTFEACRALFAPGGTFFEGLTVDSAARLRDIIVTFVETQTTTWDLLSRATLFTLLTSSLSVNAEERRAFGHGIILGVAAASSLAILYALGFDGIALQSQTSFWTKINRTSSTLTDPNALGLMAALALWTFALCPKALRFPWPASALTVALIVCGGLVSGSRSFILSAIFLGASLLWVRSRRLAVFAFLGGLAGMLALNLFAAAFPDSYQAALSAPIPESLRRVLSSLLVAQWPTAFFSRTVFSQISFSLISEHPLYGIGADRYRDYVQLFSSRLALGIGSWSDNANNFYLGLLAELGGVGFVAALATVISRRFQPEAGLFGRLAILSFAALLLTGPHVEFPEVLATSSLLLATCTVCAPRRALSGLGGAAVFLLVGMPGALHERGVYAWKNDGSEISRWLSPSAEVEATCPEPFGSPSIVTLKGAYIPSSGSVVVVAYERNAPISRVEIRSSEPVTLSIPCSRPGLRTVGLHVTPAWSPYRAWPGKASDRRILGVQQISTVGSP